MNKIKSCWGLAVIVWLAAAPVASAQVKAEIVLEQDQFLVGETLNVAVRVINRSGQSLRLGDDPDWLTFGVEAVDGSVVSQTGEVPVTGGFDLASGKVATRRVNLQPYFDLDRIGRYRLKARVTIKTWDQVITTEVKNFDIAKGARVWTQAFGMLLPEGVTNRAPEVRRYILEQANHLRTQRRLYLRVTDGPEAHVFKVLVIGPTISFSNPDPQIDRENNLHILYQSGAQAYLYTVVTPQGEITLRQTHDITSSRPRLESDAAGNFSVVGGVRRIGKDDFPAPVSPAEEFDPASTDSPATNAPLAHP
jgi:hypothetical protein